MGGKGDAFTSSRQKTKNRYRLEAANAAKKAKREQQNISHDIGGTDNLSVDAAGQRVGDNDTFSGWSHM